MNNSGHRLMEMLGVLRKHRITRGLTPVKLRKILEDLGPTYVKLGQIMSMRSDMLPERYCEELTLLRTEVKPLPFDTVCNLIEHELGGRVDEYFGFIHPTPLGSASIAQVHMAALNSGKKVVCKVQRPNIREKMAEDIALLKKATGILKAAVGTDDLIDFKTILDELWKTTQEEMNFIREAGNLDLFSDNQEEIAYITCPRVIHELTTSRLLVMDYIDGIQIDRTGELTNLGYDMTEIGEKAAENYCKQILEDGFFHADPHPGNLWVSGGKIAWLDLGMTGRLSRHNKLLLRKAITAILENDIYGLKNVLLAFGEPRDRLNHARLYTDIDEIVSRYMSMDFGSMKLSELIERLLELVKTHQIAITPDITMLGRSMITMEGTLSICSPDVNILMILSSHMSSMLLHDMDMKSVLRRKGRKAYASFDKSLDIPAQLSDLMNITKNGQARLNLEFADVSDCLGYLRRIADRLILGILSAGFFIGSSILCGGGASIPDIAGIPWISFAGFCISAFLTLWIIVRTLSGK